MAPTGICHLARRDGLGTSGPEIMRPNRRGSCAVDLGCRRLAVVVRVGIMSRLDILFRDPRDVERSCGT